MSTIRTLSIVYLMCNVTIFAPKAIAQLPFDETVQSVIIQPLTKQADRERLWESIQANAKVEELLILPGLTVEEAVRAKCGSNPSDLLAVVKKMNGYFPAGRSEELRRLRFIPCPYWYFGDKDNPPRTAIKSGQNIKDIADLFIGKNDKKTIKRLIELNPGKFRKDGTAISKGEIKLPYIVRKFNLELPLLASVGPPIGGAQNVIDVLPPKERELAQSSGITDSLKNYHLIQQVQSQSVSDARKCGWNGSNSGWPLDTEGLGAAINTARKSLEVIPNYGTILIADTGIAFDKFTEPWRWQNPRLKNGFNSFENFTNDLYGASMVTRRGDDIAPSDEYQFATHGTNVFRVVAQTGARLNLSDQPGTKNRPGIIAVAKLNNMHAPFEINATSVSTAFYYAQLIPANVLNLSVVIGLPPEDLIKFLHLSPFVIVAAAGNDGNWLDQLDLFPPGLKVAREKLLVVGAHDWNGELAEFSNRGSLVDILAPGCAIPITQADGSTIFISGTSFAAPFVSTTIAMLVGVGMPDEPASLRNRIIASGRFSNSLQSVTKYGVRLDAERAIRVKEDSLLMNSDKTPVYGELRKAQNWTCEIGGISKNFLPHMVAKVIPDYRIHGQKVTAIWEHGKNGGDLQISYCDAGFNTPTVGFKKTGAANFEEIPWDGIADVVTKESSRK